MQITKQKNRHYRKMNYDGQGGHEMTILPNPRFFDSLRRLLSLSKSRAGFKNPLCFYVILSVRVCHRFVHHCRIFKILSVLTVKFCPRINLSVRLENQNC